MIGAEAQETDRSRLNRSPASDARMDRVLHGEACDWIGTELGLAL